MAVHIQYTEWSAAWWQWALSIPTASNPLFGKTDDCNIGQPGPVWFIGGIFCVNGGSSGFSLDFTIKINVVYN